MHGLRIRANAVAGVCFQADRMAVFAFQELIDALQEIADQVRNDGRDES
jgi:hypothetical protein